MTLDQLEKKINDLNLGNGSSNPFDYFDAYDDYIEVLQDSSNADKPKLREILETFRDKIGDANLEEFNDLERWARKLDEAFVAKSVGDLIEAIRDRNIALPDLLAKLKVEIDKGNDDAEFLTDIREAIDKGTATLDELKSLVDKLTATDADTKSRIRDLIAAAKNISSTFMPDDDDA